MTSSIGDPEAIAIILGIRRNGRAEWRWRYILDRLEVLAKHMWPTVDHRPEGIEEELRKDLRREVRLILIAAKKEKKPTFFKKIAYPNRFAKFYYNVEMEYYENR